MESEKSAVKDRTDTPFFLYYFGRKTVKFKDSVSQKNPVPFKQKKAGADVKVTDV